MSNARNAKYDPKQWIYNHMKSMKTAPNGNKLMMFRIDSIVITREVTAEEWRSALRDYNVMADLRTQIISSVRGRPS